MKTRWTRVGEAVAASVATWCLVSSALLASGEPPVLLAERVKGANRVVVAKAVTVDPLWMQNQHGDRLIVSRILLEVEETLKGDSTQIISMDLEGGTIDGITMRVSDLPEVRVGERGVFFLKGNGSTALAPYKRGAGILKLDSQDVVPGRSGLRLEDIRRAAKANR